MSTFPNPRPWLRSVSKMYFRIRKLSCLPTETDVQVGLPARIPGVAAELAPPDKNDFLMARRKSPYPEQILTRHIQTKVTEDVYQRLEQLRAKSDCQTLGELARRILSKDKVTLFHKDASLDAPMEELTSIRKELHAIGVNINQITHSIHIASTDNQKNYQALRAVEEYKKVGIRVDRLLELITQLSKKWLQK